MKSNPRIQLGISFDQETIDIMDNLVEAEIKEVGISSRSSLLRRLVRQEYSRNLEAKAQGSFQTLHSQTKSNTRK